MYDSTCYNPRTQKAEAEGQQIPFEFEVEKETYIFKLTFQDEKAAHAPVLVTTWKAEAGESFSAGVTGRQNGGTQEKISKLKETTKQQRKQYQLSVTIGTTGVRKGCRVKRYEEKNDEQLPNFTIDGTLHTDETQQTLLNKAHQKIQWNYNQFLFMNYTYRCVDVCMPGQVSTEMLNLL